jgi:hypothetical protein
VSRCDQQAREVKGAHIGPPAAERIFLKRKNGYGMGSDYSVILEAHHVINACDIPVWIDWMADEKIEINRPANRPTLAVRSPQAEFAGEKIGRPTGVSVYDLIPSTDEQLEMFVPPTHAVSEAMDKINNKWGEFVITPALMMGMEDIILDRISFGGVKELEEIYSD